MAIQVSQATVDNIRAQRDAAQAAANGEDQQAQQAIVRRDEAAARATELGRILDQLQAS